MGINAVDLASLSPAEIVEKVRRTDILMAASGKGLSLSVLLLPKSGVIEVMPLNYRSSLYQKIAGEFGLFYLAHTNFTGNAAESGECTYSEEMEDIRELPKTCRENLEKGEVYIPTITLWMMMMDMSKTVSHNKYNV